MECPKQQNRWLKQKMELLEKENSALAERLVGEQVEHTKAEVEAFTLAKEVQALRRENEEARRRLGLAHDEIRLLEMTIAEGVEDGSGDNGGAEGGTVMWCLQREMLRARLQAAEREATERELEARVNELEKENKRLRQQQNFTQHLQDRLDAVKQCEMEASLSLKILRECVEELCEEWQRHFQPSPPVQSNLDSYLLEIVESLGKPVGGCSEAKEVHAHLDTAGEDPQTQRAEAEAKGDGAADQAAGVDETDVETEQKDIATEERTADDPKEIPDAAGEPKEVPAQEQSVTKVAKQV